MGGIWINNVWLPLSWGRREQFFVHSLFFKMTSSLPYPFRETHREGLWPTGKEFLIHNPESPVLPKPSSPVSLYPYKIPLSKFSCLHVHEDTKLIFTLTLGSCWVLSWKASFSFPIPYTLCSCPWLASGYSVTSSSLALVVSSLLRVILLTIA
jgi:hypothetical protein